MDCKWFKPPFDLFGISPAFYVRGKRKNDSSIGAACGLVLIISLIFLFTIKLVAFVQKKEPIITSARIKDELNPMIDLKEKEQILNLEFYPDPSTLNVAKLFKLSAYLVT